MNKIYNENCLSTLSKMKEDSVDLVITSPPYNMNLRIRNGKYCSRQIVKEMTTKYTSFSDNLPIDQYNSFHTKVLRELLRVSGLIFYNVQIVTGSKRSVFKMIGEFADNLKEIIVWDKGHAQPSMQEQVINRRTELLLVFEKDYPISRQFRNKGQFKRGALDDLWLIKRSKRNSFKGHGATFPPELVETILQNFSKENDLVYDPFMGTGTTALVAKNLNRNFIGSEICKDYIEISNQRLENNERDFPRFRGNTRMKGINNE
jgi:site-specific DNA-methyltransferase (adenine-specific)/modification methylase